MNRYKDIDLCAKLIKKEFSLIKSSGVSMYQKGRRDGLVLANAILRDDKRVHTADVIEVVRCKDCKYFLDKHREDRQGICMCGEKDTSYASDFYPYANDFCSYGERKDEE